MLNAVTGLHYNWHRSYDASLGRYTQPDPLGFVDGPSVYGYARSSPQRWVDFTGLMAGPGNPSGGLGSCPPCKKKIYRAVKPEEVRDLIATGKFRNLPGLECKYFSTTEFGARSYAAQASAAFNEQYWIVEAEIPCADLDRLPPIIVDRNVPAICVPTLVLPFLTYRVIGPAI